MDLKAWQTIYSGCVNFYPIPTPIPKGNTDYKNAFKSYCGNEITNAFLEQIVSAKLALVTSLINKSSWQTILTDIDNYLPLVITLSESLLECQKQGSPVRVERDLFFEWKLMLSAGIDNFRSQDILFEIIMLYQLKAIAHYNHAKSLLSTDLLSFLTEAGKHFLSASSVLEYLKQQIDSTVWLKKFSIPGTSIPNPPEATGSFCAGLALYYRACAQMVALLKALTNETNKTSPNVKTRLTVAALNHIKQSIDKCVQSVPGGNKLSLWIPMDFMNYLGCFREILYTLTYFFWATNSASINETGKALALCRVAKSHLNDQSSRYDLTLPGLPKRTTSFLLSLTGFIQQILAMIAFEEKEIDQTNRFIHFQTIPTDINDLPPLPVEAALMVPPTFTPFEVVEKIPFVPPPKSASFFGSLFGGSKPKETKVEPKSPAPASVTTSTTPTTSPGTSSAPLNPNEAYVNTSTSSMVAPAAVQHMTDAEYAQLLQRQYDSEANRVPPVSATSPATNNPPPMVIAHATLPSTNYNPTSPPPPMSGTYPPAPPMTFVPPQASAPSQGDNFNQDLYNLDKYLRK